MNQALSMNAFSKRDWLWCTKPIYGGWDAYKRIGGHKRLSKYEVDDGDAIFTGYRFWKGEGTDWF
jgi:hypothetical protein